MYTETGKEFNKILSKWKRNNAEMNSTIAEKFETEFDNIISKIDSLIKDDSEEAFGYLIAVVYTMNEAIKKNPEILEKLLEWIKKLKKYLDVIIDEIGADNYSISVAAPWGISVGISFSPK